MFVQIYNTLCGCVRGIVFLRKQFCCRRKTFLIKIDLQGLCRKKLCLKYPYIRCKQTFYNDMELRCGVLSIVKLFLLGNTVEKTPPISRQKLYRTSELTRRSPSTTKVHVLYANSLDLDETPSNSASYLDPSCFKLREHFRQL